MCSYFHWTCLALSCVELDSIHHGVTGHKCFLIQPSNFKQPFERTPVKSLAIVVLVCMSYHLRWMSHSINSLAHPLSRHFSYHGFTLVQSSFILLPTTLSVQHCTHVKEINYNSSYSLHGYTLASPLRNWELCTLWVCAYVDSWGDRHRFPRRSKLQSWGQTFQTV